LRSHAIAHDAHGHGAIRLGEETIPCSIAMKIAAVFPWFDPKSSALTSRSRASAGYPSKALEVFISSPFTCREWPWPGMFYRLREIAWVSVVTVSQTPAVGEWETWPMRAGAETPSIFCLSTPFQAKFVWVGG
jgi:hypothetical protein